MNIENHIHNAKTALDFTRIHVSEKNYDTALAMLCNVMTETRDLIVHVWDLKCEASKVEVSAGEDGT